MNIQQLRYVCEVAQMDLNVSKAAQALHTSQPGISTQIRQLEEELGFAIFTRQRNRFTGITSEGAAVIEHARRSLKEIAEIKEIGRHRSQDHSGSLVIAASHTQARFTLPRVLQAFIRKYPNVRITVSQGGGRQTIETLNAANADIGILSSMGKLTAELQAIACHTYKRILLVPPGHPLLTIDQPSLADIAQYQMVLYEPSKTGTDVVNALRAKGLDMPSFLRAPNADVVKAYVEHGLGVSILPAIVFDPARDPGLRAIPVSHLFADNATYVVLHRKNYLRDYAYDFIEMLEPHLTRQVVESAMEG
ncbi:LysR substrate-binding domain-containing protein [Hydrogenophaga sp. BPS33]|uniref:LysR substrate-binding domain-containing protein n=1 Tax=Hydrogenophaga sp. BPS33 TaxID=2651974 RepID=UPI001320114C|nr:LysR substrate-binding domain-containing protein [Hydrogenophaga sp. BPS33]QHE84199.1 LysR family transcriptional regulator [Hydrogenophaga sp. BPS33]